MATITLSRQLGSRGDEVAQAIGERLGYGVVYQELINAAAQRAGTPELALEVLDVLGLLQTHPTAHARQAFQQALQELMMEMADQGQVILIGRAGCVLLRERLDVFHVRLVAPMHQRVERIAQQRSLSLAAAQAQVEASDQTRRTYLRHHHHANWDDPHLYDLVINMEKLTVASAAALVCLACTNPFSKPEFPLERPLD
jgi:cytidylate kinase